jgi:hypothetical protein
MNHNTQTANKTAENMAIFSYFGRTMKMKVAFRKTLTLDAAQVIKLI